MKLALLVWGIAFIVIVLVIWDLSRHSGDPQLGKPHLRKDDPYGTIYLDEQDNLVAIDDEHDSADT